MSDKPYLTKCGVCGQQTNKVYANKNGGKCKPCVTGEPRKPTESSDSRNGRLIDSGYQAYAREEGHFDGPDW